MRSRNVLLCAVLLCVGCSGGGGGQVIPPPPVITVSVAPGTATVTPGTNATFTATVTGTTNSPTWLVNDVQGGNASLGTIASSGMTGIYTPPASVPSSTNFTVKATATSGSFLMWS